MKKRVLLIVTVLAGVMLVQSCAGHKDCQGHRHKIKTDMGGYM